MSEEATMIDDCEKRESKLSEWEKDFLSNISKRLERGGSLSELQIETLDRIWNRVTS